MNSTESPSCHLGMHHYYIVHPIFKTHHNIDDLYYYSMMLHIPLLIIQIIATGIRTRLLQVAASKSDHSERLEQLAECTYHVLTSSNYGQSCVVVVVDQINY